MILTFNKYMSVYIARLEAFSSSITSTKRFLLLSVDFVIQYDVDSMKINQFN